MLLRMRHTTLVSPLRRDGTPHARCVGEDGAVLFRARKERATLNCLVASEVGQVVHRDAAIPLLAKAKTRHVLHVLRRLCQCTGFYSVSLGVLDWVFQLIQHAPAGATSAPSRACLLADNSPIWTNLTASPPGAQKRGLFCTWHALECQ